MPDQIPDHKLRIAHLPIDVAWGDPAENLFQLSTALGTLPFGADIVVLPELFTTGYLPDPKQIPGCTEGPDGPTVEALRRHASHHSVAIAGSYLCYDGHDFFNRGFFIEPGGEATYYDKRHLFTPSGEAEAYTAGSELPPVVRYRGFNVSLIVCFDLRFPVWCRSRADDPYDILLVPANWGKAREYAWQHLLIARAIENQAYVVGANRAGADDYGEYTGTSAIYDPMGKPVATAVEGTPWLVAEVSSERIEKTRLRMPTSLARDKFSIQIH